ncbi:MAG: acyltransferase family protein [Candidatus Dadabacteria bacterium]|nr:MAG: acyltransferase family protein [Candidatus Dadabacteria bacterium]
MWIDQLITEADRERFQKIQIRDLGFGYDPFGLNVDALLRAYAIVKTFYRDYFRVTGHGTENIPGQGRAILVANHSGGLPIDGMMIGMDVLEHTDPPRLVRAVVDRFVAGLPWINTVFARVGQVIGVRRNFEVLLENEEIVLVFPEGSPGIVKPWPKRYRLQTFNVGFLELHLQYRAPIIPVAVVGAEEQQPILATSGAIGKALGVSDVPITLNALLSLIFGPLALLPFPTKYDIYYGEPIRFYEEFAEDTVQNPEMVETLTLEVKERIQKMIDDGLERRKTVFGG